VSQQKDHAVVTIDYGKGNGRLIYRLTYDVNDHLDQLDCRDSAIAIERVCLKHSLDIITTSGEEELCVY
jgi:hypothetical protein